MTINEDTGEEVACPICGALEYWDCGHLVASLDRSFCECQGGELYDRMSEFSSILESAFLPHLKQGSAPDIKGLDLEELWKVARQNFDPNYDDVDLDGFIFQRVVIELLREAGAYYLPGSLMDPGGPGMTSSISVLFAEEPARVIEKAICNLNAQLDVEWHTTCIERGDKVRH